LENLLRSKASVKKIDKKWRKKCEVDIINLNKDILFKKGCEKNKEEN